VTSREKFADQLRQAAVEAEQALRDRSGDKVYASELFDAKAIEVALAAIGMNRYIQPADAHALGLALLDELTAAFSEHIGWR